MIQYHLEFKIYDADSGAAYSPVYQDKAELDVKTLTSIGDRQALCTLFHILKNQLLEQGSTVLEKRALSAHERVTTDATVAEPENFEPRDQPL